MVGFEAAAEDVTEPFWAQANPSHDERVVLALHVSHADAGDAGVLVVVEVAAPEEVIPDGHVDAVVIGQAVLIVEVADAPAGVIFGEEMLETVSWVVALAPRFEVELPDVLLVDEDVPRARDAVPPQLAGVGIPRNIPGN